MMSEGALRLPRTSCSSYVVLRVLTLAYGRRSSLSFIEERHEFLIWALGGVGRSASSSGRITPWGRKSRYVLARKFSGTVERGQRCGGEEKMSAPDGT